MRKRLFPATEVILAVAGGLVSTGADALDWRGNVSSELTLFPQFSVGTENWKLNTSFAADVELSQDLTDNILLTAHPFIRWDQQDDERTVAGVRELLISIAGDTWELNAGLGKVFWGVTESHNPVDIINQTDFVEDLTGDEKLGEPMLNLNWFSDNYGEFGVFLLPQFQERTTIGENGRPTPGIAVDRSLTTFESSDGDDDFGYALRWTRSFDTWDVGLHYFDGTSRNPTFIPVISDTGAVLAPRYSLLRQTGIDALGLYGDLAVKAEVIYQTGGEIESHAVAVTGIEYTLTGLLSPLQENDKLPEDWCTPDVRNPFKKLACNDRIDLGLVLEYLWNQRGTDSNQLYQNDLLLGFRFAFNDAATSDALFGILQDLDGGATTLSIEASTRLFESYRLKVFGQQFVNTGSDTILDVFDRESFLQVDFSYFF